MDVYVALVVGTTLMGATLFLGYAMWRDLQTLRKQSEWMDDQRRLMRRLESVPFYTLDRDKFFDQVNEYRSAFDAPR